MKTTIYTIISQLLGFGIFAISVYIPIDGIHAFKHIFTIQFLKLYPVYIFMLLVSLLLLFIVKKYYKFTLASCMTSVIIATLITSLVLAKLLQIQSIDVAGLMYGITIGTILGALTYGYILWLFIKAEQLKNA